MPRAEARKAAKKVRQKEKEEAQKKAASRRKARPVVVPEGANPYIKPKKDDAEVEDFMSSLIGGLDGQETVSKKAIVTPKSAAPPRFAKTAVSGLKRRAEDDSSSLRPISRNISSSSIATSDPDSSDTAAPGRDTAPSSEGDGFGGKKPRYSAVELEGIGGLDPMDHPQEDSGPIRFMDVDEDSVKPKVEDDEDDDEILIKPAAAPSRPKGAPARRQLVNATTIKPIKAEPTVDDKIPPAGPVPTASNIKTKSKGMDWRTATAALATLATPEGDATDFTMDDEADPLPMPESLIRPGMKVEKVDKVNAFEDDRSVRFWWFDYIEPGPGKLVLVGKVKAKGGRFDGKWVSATVQITGIKRKLYVLPRRTELDGKLLFRALYTLAAH